MGAKLLKNLAEQISILEVDERIIDANKLTHYLQMNNGQSISGSLIRRNLEDKQADSFSERELLYKILFDMRKLKRLPQKGSLFFSGRDTHSVFSSFISNPHSLKVPNTVDNTSKMVTF